MRPATRRRGPRRGERGARHRRREARRRARASPSSSITTRSRNAEENVRAQWRRRASCTVIEGDAHVLLPLVAPVRVIAREHHLVACSWSCCPRSRDALRRDGAAILSGILVEERERDARRRSTARRLARGRRGRVRTSWWSVSIERARRRPSRRSSRRARSRPGRSSRWARTSAHHMRVRRLDVGDRRAAARRCRARRAHGHASCASRKSHARRGGRRRARARRAAAGAPARARSPTASACCGSPRRRRSSASRAGGRCSGAARGACRRAARASAFQAKVRARMVAALEQSGGAWLPDAASGRAARARAARAARRRHALVLDPDGAPLRRVRVARARSTSPSGPRAGSSRASSRRCERRRLPSRAPAGQHPALRDRRRSSALAHRPRAARPRRPSDRPRS